VEDTNWGAGFGFFVVGGCGTLTRRGSMGSLGGGGAGGRLAWLTWRLCSRSSRNDTIDAWCFDDGVLAASCRTESMR